MNTATGEFYHTFMDVSVPGRGIPLGLSRTYSTANAASDGPLGFGWADSYQGWGLSLDSGSGDVTVGAGNGSSVVFTPDGLGGFTAPAGVHAVLVKNGDGSFTFTEDQSQQSYEFSAAGQLAVETDRNGYQTTLAYNGSNQLVTVTDPAGRTLTFTYDSSGKVASATDPAGHAWSYTYDQAGNLATATNPLGGVWIFTYDSNHRILTMTDPRGGLLTNTYDTVGRVAAQTDAMGRKTGYAYLDNPDGTEATTVTDPRGFNTVYTYQNLELQSVTRGSGTAVAATTSYTYDPATLRVATVTDPNGHTTTNIFDASGNLLTSTDALGRRTSNTYNSLNEVLTTTDPKGVTTTNTYDAHGNLLSTSTPIGARTAKTTYTYADSAHPGDVTGKTDPLGKTWTYTYGTNGDRTSATDPLGDKTTSAYDTIGRLLSATTPLGHTTSYTYDALGDLLTTSDPLGHKTTRTYDKNQNLATVKDSKGNTSTYAYDKDNEQTKQVRKSATNTVVQTVSAAYDEDGNVTKQVDGLGQATAYTYNALNRKTSTTDPLARKTRYRYDRAGNLVALIDPSAHATQYTYDAANQLKRITYSDGTTPTVSYQYDKDGQRVSMTDGTGTTTSTYDGLHRLTKNTNGAGATVIYTYDLRGDLATLIYPTGNKVTRAYDTAGRLTSVTDWLTHKTRFAYDDDGNLISEGYPNGVTASFAYDTADQLMSVADTSGANHLLSLTYTRDSVGLLTSENATRFAYDALDRLTSADGFSFSYDAANNPSNLAGATQTFDASSQITQQVNGSITTSYTYNTKGNRTSQTPTSGPTTTLTYNQANQLTGWADGTTAATYVYNGDDLRMTRTINAGTPEQYTWDTAEGLPLIIQDGTTSYITGPGGLPVEQLAGTTPYYIQHDQLGSTRLLTDHTGTVLNSYTYSPYGRVTAARRSAASTTPFLYAGQYTDLDSGLIYLRARYYDPRTAEFASVDPFVAQTRQPYSYGLDTPTNLVDESGADACDTGWGDLVPACKEVLYCGSVMECAGVINDLENARQELAADFFRNQSNCGQVEHDLHDLQLLNQAERVLITVQLPHFNETHWTNPILQKLCYTAEGVGTFGAGVAVIPVGTAAGVAAGAGGAGLGISEVWGYGPCS